MTLIGRIGLVLSNIILLIPVYILLLITAIMSSIGAENLKNLSNGDKAYSKMVKVTITLWVLFGGSLIFFLTLGLFIMPYLIGIPYLYGGLMFIFAIINFVLSIYLFYGANVARTSNEFKNKDKKANKAFNNLLVCGILMFVGSILMIIYGIYIIYKYSKIGGITGDIKIGSEIAPIIQPELAPLSLLVGQIADKELKSEQKLSETETKQLQDLTKLLQEQISKTKPIEQAVKMGNNILNK
jgi:hypothetical protein